MTSISTASPPALPGVYAITNRITSRKYVGETKDLSDRKRFNLSALRRGKHHNHDLQAEFIEFGESSFDFDVLEYCSAESKIQRQCFYIREMKTTDPQYGYNLVIDDVGCHEIPPGELCRRRKILSSSWTTERRQRAADSARYQTKSVCQYTKSGAYIRTFPSRRDAAKDLGVDGTKISPACNGKRKTAYGFQWRLLRDVSPGEDITPVSRKSRQTESVE